jgi:thioredoxin 1
LGENMAVLIITNENHKIEIEDSKIPVLIDVYAPWCGPCQHMTPILDELEKEIGDKYKICKINVDESRELAIKYGISSIPAFIFIKNNQIVAKEVGYISKEDLKEKLEKYFG